MPLFLLLTALAATPLFAEISLPAWGKAVDSTGYSEGMLYTVERVPTKSGEQFQVEIRPLACESIVLANPKCSFEYYSSDYNSPPTLTKLKSPHNGTHCKLESFTELKLVNQKIRAYDGFDDFKQGYFLSHSVSQMVKGEKLRSSNHFLDPSCITWDDSLANK